MNTGTRGRPAWANTALVSTASLILAFAVAMVIMVVTDAEIMAKYAYFIARPGMPAPPRGRPLSRGPPPRWFR